jgi:hypothetical protein
MKVVYNGCYGGFSLSDKAIARYWELKGTEPPKDWYNRNIERDDPLFVQVVEELGKEANGSFANLLIGEVAKGKRWRIDEYDGHESVMTDDEYEWKIAT